MRILLIEDDTILGAAVRDHVVADNHSVDWVTRLDAANDHLGDIPRAFIAALKEGELLVLAFDVTAAANATDGTAHETVAEFPLAGSRAALDEALAACR